MEALESTNSAEDMYNPENELPRNREDDEVKLDELRRLIALCQDGEARSIANVSLLKDAIDALGITPHDLEQYAAFQEHEAWKEDLEYYKKIFNEIEESHRTQENQDKLSKKSLQLAQKSESAAEVVEKEELVQEESLRAWFEKRDKETKISLLTDIAEQQSYVALRKKEEWDIIKNKSIDEIDRDQGESHFMIMERINEIKNAVERWEGERIKKNITKSKLLEAESIKDYLVRINFVLNKEGYKITVSHFSNSIDVGSVKIESNLLSKK